MERLKTAAYCRLSRDDEQSESIANQRLLIESYINSHSEFELTDVYEDDGVTGMTYDRVAFLRMMRDIDAGRINAIIVKDLSRIGREQIETLNLIKREFILKNIRFIAITDDYDSFDRASDSLSTSVKLLLNDYYCADISKKVRSAQKAKRERGDFIGSHAPYGYIKDPENKNRLIIDKTAAMVVKKIFSLYISGYGKQAIARILNAEGIPNPTVYKQNILGQNYKNSNRLFKTSGWTYTTIHKMLQSRVYIGDTVQHRSEIRAYNIHKKTALPQAKWCIVENTHKPIIDKADFENVQRLLKTKASTPDMTRNISKYTGLFFCKDCGRAMNKYLSRKKKDGTRYIAFKCATYSHYGKSACTIHSIREDELDSIILDRINKILKDAIDKNISEYIRKNTKNNIATDNREDIRRLKSSLEACETRRKTMLAYLSEGIITAEDFALFDSENKSRADIIKQSIISAENPLLSKQSRASEHTAEIEDILVNKSIQTVTRELLVGLVDKICISENENLKEIEIFFKFKAAPFFT